MNLSMNLSLTVVTTVFYVLVYSTCSYASAVPSYYNDTVEASECSQWKSCSNCVKHQAFSGDCFWCSEDNSCHDHLSVVAPSSCNAGGCVSESSLTDCSGTCGGETVDGFPVKTSICMANAANVAYATTTSQLKTQLSAIDLTLVNGFWDSSSDTMGFVATSSKDVVLSFRGTELTVENGILDIDIVYVNAASYISNPSIPKSWNICQGFADAYLSLKSDVLKNLQASVKGLSNPILYVTGHSLGASMASVCVMDLMHDDEIKNLFESIHLINFASPRTGDQNFAEGMTSLVPVSWLVQEYFDQIPHLPPEIANYQHIQRIAVVGPNAGNIRVSLCIYLYVCVRVSFSFCIDVYTVSIHTLYSHCLSIHICITDR